MARSDTISYVALVVALATLAYVFYVQHKLKKMCTRGWDLGGMVAKMGQAWERVPPEDKERAARRAQRMARRAAEQIEPENPKGAWLLREVSGDADTPTPGPSVTPGWRVQW